MIFKDYKKGVNLKGVTLKHFMLSFISFYTMISAAQDTASYELTLEVNQVYVPLSISEKTLKDAKTIEDINPYYKPSWVKEFESVELTAIIDGSKKKALSKNDLLTKEQKDLMEQADFGSDISIVVTYLPDNTLKHNEVKKYDFTFIINPIAEAQYPGGSTQLAQYFTENAMNKIPDESFHQNNVIAIQFTIDEEGEVEEAYIPTAVENLLPKHDKDATDILLQTICAMPAWKPAEYSDGTKVKQDFVLTAGDHMTCTMNLLNVRREITTE